jgi:hypothetical protein
VIANVPRETLGERTSFSDRSDAGEFGKALSDTYREPTVCQIEPAATATNKLNRADTPNAVCNVSVRPALSLSGPSAFSAVENVPAYLANRKPCPNYQDELPLFVKLPFALRSEVEVFTKAFNYVQSLVNDRLSVVAACKKALALYHRTLSLPAETFRSKYKVWVKTGDWVTLVNRSKAGADWCETNIGLPDAFIEKVCGPYFGRFGRSDGKRQAIFAIKRWWRTGRDISGQNQPMPGYEAKWGGRNLEVYPNGWHYSNILRQVRARAIFTKPVQKLLQEGISAAKEFLPQNLSTRSKLRFLELVTFDDVRTDFLIFDPATGQPCELWLLVARDQATGLVLGFVMHPSRVREDGSDSHLGLQEMKQLSGFILERYPLPVDYVSTWKVERGTATLSEGSARALAEMLPNRIFVSFTSMIGGKSPVGYQEKAKGNSRGKASHESHNRLFHTQGCYLPGQTGARYEIRPADLQARCDESVETWKLAQKLPAHLRGKEKYTLLTPNQARAALIDICFEQNSRTDHEMEGFEEVLEWLDANGKWQHQSTFTGDVQRAKFRKRKESPIERCVRLIQGCKWERVSPDIIIAFYSHVERPVTINDAGEIEFRHDGRNFIFANPGSVIRAASGLGYFHPDDPKFVHVTNGKGSFLGTWLRRDRLANDDKDAIAESFRYCDAALKAAKAQAEKLAAPQRAELEDVRAQNAELLHNREFVEVTAPPTAPTILESPIAAALAAVAVERAENKAAAKREARAAAETILAPREQLPTSGSSAADDLLSALISKT